MLFLHGKGGSLGNGPLLRCCASWFDGKLPTLPSPPSTSPPGATVVAGAPPGKAKCGVGGKVPCFSRSACCRAVYLSRSPQSWIPPTHMPILQSRGTAVDLTGARGDGRGVGRRGVGRRGRSVCGRGGCDRRPRLRARRHCRTRCRHRKAADAADDIAATRARCIGLAVSANTTEQRTTPPKTLN